MNKILITVIITVLLMLIIVSIATVVYFRKDGMSYHAALEREDYSTREKAALLASHKLFHLGLYVLIGSSSGLLFGILGAILFGLLK